MTRKDDAETLGFAAHDHDGCITDAMRAAEARCAQEGLRLTPVRRRVLEMLLQEHVALGAYAILDRLHAEGWGSQPPVAYRALDFLAAHGFVHRIERLNAFVACTQSGEDHVPAFLICGRCDTVAETTSRDVGQAFDATARASGFTIGRTVLEAEGLCPACRDGVAA